MTRRMKMEKAVSMLLECVNLKKIFLNWPKLCGVKFIVEIITNLQSKLFNFPKRTQSVKLIIIKISNQKHSTVDIKSKLLSFYGVFLKSVFELHVR